MGKIGPATEPFEIIHIDTKSGFNQDKEGKKHLHLAIDSFTRFVWHISSSSKRIEELQKLVNKISSIQIPKLIVCDNYSSMAGPTFKAFLKPQGIQILYSSPAHQCSNGLVERVKQTLVERLRCKVMDSGHNNRI